MHIFRNFTDQKYSKKAKGHLEIEAAIFLRKKKEAGYVKWYGNFVNLMMALECLTIFGRIYVNLAVAKVWFIRMKAPPIL